MVWKCIRWMTNLHISSYIQILEQHMLSSRYPLFPDRLFIFQQENAKPQLHLLQQQVKGMSRHLKHDKREKMMTNKTLDCSQNRTRMRYFSPKSPTAAFPQFPHAYRLLLKAEGCYTVVNMIPSQHFYIMLHQIENKLFFFFSLKIVHFLSLNIGYDFQILL